MRADPENARRRTLSDPQQGQVYGAYGKRRSPHCRPRVGGVSACGRDPLVSALLLAPAPAAVVTLAGLLAASLLRVGAPGSEAGPPLSHSAPEALRWAFSGFSSPLVWLVFSVAMIGTGVEKTGLGVRIGHILTRCLGKSALGLGYAVTLTETLLALVVPSATARSGVVQPLVMGIPALCRSGPARSPRAIGAYLSWVAFASSCVASSLFLSLMLILFRL